MISSHLINQFLSQRTRGSVDKDREARERAEGPNQDQRVPNPGGVDLLILIFLHLNRMYPLKKMIPIISRGKEDLLNECVMQMKNLLKLEPQSNILPRIRFIILATSRKCVDTDMATCRLPRTTACLRTTSLRQIIMAGSRLLKESCILSMNAHGQRFSLPS